MFIRRSTNLLKSAFRFKGAFRQGFATTKLMSYGKFPRALMLCAALLPATMLYYCADDNTEVFETDANLK
jgi:hypothetical protein